MSRRGTARLGPRDLQVFRAQLRTPACMARAFLGHRLACSSAWRHAGPLGWSVAGGTPGRRTLCPCVGARDGHPTRHIVCTPWRQAVGLVMWHGACLHAVGHSYGKAKAACPRLSVACVRVGAHASAHAFPVRVLAISQTVWWRAGLGVVVHEGLSARRTANFLGVALDGLARRRCPTHIRREEHDLMGGRPPRCMAAIMAASSGATHIVCLVGSTEGHPKLRDPGLQLVMQRCALALVSGRARQRQCPRFGRHRCAGECL